MNLVFLFLVAQSVATKPATTAVQAVVHCDFRIEQVDTERRQVVASSRFVFGDPPGTITLADGGSRLARQMQASSGLGTGEQTRVDIRVWDGDGRPLKFVTQNLGLVVDAGAAGQVVVQKRLWVPDRSRGQASQHPYGATLSASSGVFLGLHLFVEPPHGLVRQPIQLMLLADQDWQMVSVFGEGRRQEVDDLQDLMQQFFLIGDDLEVVGQQLGSASFRAAYSRRDFDQPLELSQDLLRVAYRAHQTFGPAPQHRLLSLLQPFRETQNQRVLSQRGGSTGQTTLTYVDLLSRSAYTEHPLSVVGHEISHWWNPRGLPWNGSVPAWLAEGITTYYEHLLMLRADLIDLEGFAQIMAEQNLRIESTGGRKLSLRRASESFASVPGAAEIVYRRGVLLGFLLDHEIRMATQQQKGLDHWLLELLERGRRGEPLNEEKAHRTLEEMAGAEVLGWLTLHLAKGGPAVLDEALRRLGFAPRAVELPFLGFEISAEQQPTVGRVHPQGPSSGRLQRGDRILRVDGTPVSSLEDFRRGLESLTPGQPIEVDVQRLERAVPVQLTVGRRPGVQVVPIEGQEQTRNKAENLLRQTVAEH